MILKTIYLYENNDRDTLRLFKNSALYFIPFVNVDGFKYISEKFNETGQLLYIRKNRNDGKKDGYQACADDEYFGVDLNRNYDYSFGSSDIGSSGEPCGEDYRGPYAFSEPETKAIKNFVESHSDIAMTFNFHAWGNLFIIPFNSDPSTQNSILLTKYREQAEIYSELIDTIGLPDGNIKGNAMQSIQYEANGEASDWFLGQHHIVAVSPELGLKEKDSETFFISDPKLLKKILVQNNEWVFKVLRKMES